jgi:hypothetical protein
LSPQVTKFGRILGLDDVGEHRMQVSVPRQSFRTSCFPDDLGPDRYSFVLLFERWILSPISKQIGNFSPT